MIDFSTSNGGLFGSLRRVFDTGKAILKNRVELAGLELKEEKSRLVSAAIWAGAFLFSTIMAVIAIALTLLFFFWEQKLYVAIGLLAFCLIGAITTFLLVRHRCKTPLPFAETIAQFKKDRAWLQDSNWIG
ncbi:MAG: phage holin family protein [Verrucomicrobiota bacterium]